MPHCRRRPAVRSRPFPGGGAVATDIGSSPTQLSVDQALSTTRNVRKRLDMTRPVPRELLEECARVAMQAPIACNGFYPHFVVVTEPAVKAALAPLYKRSWDIYVPMPISALWGSVLPQAWSFMVAARARGLASAWTQIHIQFEKEAASILGIDYDQVQQAAMIAVGYPIGTEFKAAYREPIDKFMHWNTW